ncbi:GNAT family N-acetyltransferase [Loktanella agnita]|uniref:GNAT family N-acetyltransferase n=1 Tax=Loktanella agnita TaxID=287097 RepID=UPI003989B67B
MTFALRKGCYVVGQADGPAELAACQRLRYRCFFGGTGIDADRFDPLCQHLMVADVAGRLLATVRIALWRDPAAIVEGYAAQFYNLSGLACAPGPMVELGRFCVDPTVLDADVLRVLWGALARLVDEAGAQFLFGCTSFTGTDPAPYGAAFAMLSARHCGPEGQRPVVKALETVRFDVAAHDSRDALRQMPSLLRSYLSMGGWVSDHAVVDRDLQTLHVFTCVPVAAIPAGRVRALRAVAS